MEDLVVTIAIFLAIAFAILAAIAAAIAAVALCGSVYGSYKALVCYGTALKRTYGEDEYYEASTRMKVLAAFALILIPVILFAVFFAIAYALNLL